MKTWSCASYCWRLWYVANAKSVRHFILVSIDKKGAQVEAIDDSGKLIEQTFIERKASE